MYLTWNLNKLIFLYQFMYQKFWESIIVVTDSWIVNKRHIHVNG